MEFPGAVIRLLNRRVGLRKFADGKPDEPTWYVKFKRLDENRKIQVLDFTISDEGLTALTFLYCNLRRAVEELDPATGDHETEGE